MSETYKIGQVLYIISPKTQAVIPVQIQEINRKTTIEGEETHYLVMDPEGRGPHNLSNINGQIFTNSSDVAKTLKDNASKAIDAMVSHALDVAKEKFGKSGTNDLFLPSKSAKTIASPPPLKKVSENTEEGLSEVEVIGPDGKVKTQKQKIRIHLPGEVHPATG